MSHKIEFLDDMKTLIFDPKRFPEDQSLFSSNSQWRLVPFSIDPLPEHEGVPSNAYLKKKGMSGNNFDEIWGHVSS